MCLSRHKLGPCQGSSTALGSTTRSKGPTWPRLCPGERIDAVFCAVGALPCGACLSRLPGRRLGCLGQGGSDERGSFVAQDNQVEVLGALVRQVAVAPICFAAISFGGVSGRAALCHRARQFAGRAGADEHLRRAVAATAADRHRAAQRPHLAASITCRTCCR